MRLFRISSLAALCIAMGASAAAALAAAPLTASGPVSDQVPKFEQAIADRSCAELVPLLSTENLRGPGTQPGAPPSGDECNRFSANFRIWKGYHATGTADLGTAALVAAKKPGTSGFQEQIWLLDPDSVYRYVSGVAIGHSSIGRKFLARKQAAKTTRKFVSALRNHDCDGLVGVTLSNGSLVAPYKTRKAYCHAILGGKLAKDLKSSPGAKPVFEGGTGGFGFFYIQTKSSLATIYVERLLHRKHVRYGLYGAGFNQG